MYWEEQLNDVRYGRRGPTPQGERNPRNSPRIQEIQEANGTWHEKAEKIGLFDIWECFGLELLLSLLSLSNQYQK